MEILPNPATSEEARNLREILPYPATGEHGPNKLRPYIAANKRISCFLTSPLDFLPAGNVVINNHSFKIPLLTKHAV